MCKQQRREIKCSNKTDAKTNFSIQFYFFKRLMLTEMITVVDSLGFKLAIKQDVFIETDSY